MLIDFSAAQKERDKSKACKGEDAHSDKWPHREGDDQGAGKSCVLENVQARLCSAFLHLGFLETRGKLSFRYY